MYAINYSLLFEFIYFAPSLLMKHLVIGKRQKTPYFSASHWSPHGRLVSTGKHFVTTRVVHLPKKDRNKLNYRSGPKHRIRPCIAATAGYFRNRSPVAQ